MTKWIICAVTTLALTTVTVGSHQIHADGASKFLKDDAKSKQQALDIKEPNGQSAKFTDVHYTDNHSINSGEFRKVTDLKGVHTDSDVSKMGGQIKMKKLMSYQQYYDLGIASSLRHDIDPNRMVWVIQTKFSEHIVNGVEVKNPTITSVYDAQTGDMISVHVYSPNGLPMHMPK